MNGEIRARPSLPPENRVRLQQGRYNQADDGHDVNQDVHGRTRGVLERVADSVADNYSRMDV